MTHEELWDFKRNGYERNIVRQIPFLQASHRVTSNEVDLLCPRRLTSLSESGLKQENIPYITARMPGDLVGNKHPGTCS